MIQPLETFEYSSNFLSFIFIEIRPQDMRGKWDKFLFKNRIHVNILRLITKARQKVLRLTKHLRQQSFDDWESVCMFFHQKSNVKDQTTVYDNVYKKWNCRKCIKWWEKCDNTSCQNNQCYQHGKLNVLTSDPGNWNTNMALDIDVANDRNDYDDNGGDDWKPSA